MRGTIYKWRRLGRIVKLPRSDQPSKISPTWTPLIHKVTKDPRKASKELQTSLISVTQLSWHWVRSTSTAEWWGESHCYSRGTFKSATTQLHGGGFGSGGRVVVHQSWDLWPDSWLLLWYVEASMEKTLNPKVPPVSKTSCSSAIAVWVCVFLCVQMGLRSSVKVLWEPLDKVEKHRAFTIYMTLKVEQFERQGSRYIWCKSNTEFH